MYKQCSYYVDNLQRESVSWLLYDKNAFIIGYTFLNWQQRNYRDLEGIFPQSIYNEKV